MNDTQNAHIDGGVTSNITYNDNVLDDAFILIKYNNKVKLNSSSERLLKQFMLFINGMIGAKTSANYQILNVENNTIKIPIYLYTNNDKNKNPIDLIHDRIKVVRDFLENFNWNSVNKRQLWVVRSLRALNINISNAFTMSTVTPKLEFDNLNNEPIVIKYPNLEETIIKRENYSDGSFITYLSDPYLTDYAVFLNLTTSFNDMGMSYNGLHLYEHLMTKAWDNLNGSELVEMNGSTWPHALCYIYSIHSTLLSMKEHAAHAILWRLQSREHGFWNKHKDKLKLEIERTVSETRTERTLTNMGRSDLHAYNYDYDTNIFEYWSNKPFELLIAGPLPYIELKLNKNTIENVIGKYLPREDIVRPPNIVFKHIPMDVLKVKKMSGLRIRKMNKEEIKNKLLSSKLDLNVLYGLDCTFVSENEYLGVYNNILHPLLFNGSMFTEEELNTFAKKHVIPFSTVMFEQTSLYTKMALQYLDEEES